MRDIRDENLLIVTEAMMCKGRYYRSSIVMTIACTESSNFLGSIYYYIPGCYNLQNRHRWVRFALME